MILRPFSTQSVLGKRILAVVQRYDHDKYWYRRAIVIDPKAKVSLPVKLYYLYYIKNIDSYYSCSFGTNINSGAKFASPPILPHGHAGIIVGHDVEIGKDTVIFQQVTIAHGKVIIGDNVLLGAASKILPYCCIGSNAKIGANCVVAESIPDSATAILSKSRIILKQE